MTRLHIRRNPRAGEGGFVIIAVVMFVLALTILGLSLFGLSDFEAQFMGNSLDETQAFYDASGGTERAKLILRKRNSLAAVKDDLDPPLEGVVYARARYVENPADSTSSPIDWEAVPPREIEIRVLAVVKGARKMLEARFLPEKRLTVYENVISSAGKILASQTPVPGESYDPSKQVFVSGSARQNAPDTTWSNLVNRSRRSTIVGAVPLPETQSYIDQKSFGAITPARVPDGGEFVYNLEDPSKGTRFYLGPDFGGSSHFGLHETNTKIEIKVKGTAIWMFEKGCYFKHRVEVKGGGNDRLIMIARKSTHRYFPDSLGMPHPGLWFQGGLKSDKVPIILVSDGTVALDQFNNWDQDAEIKEYLSIFAGGVFLKGPKTGKKMTLTHDTSKDVQILGPLYNAGLLPNLSESLGNQLTLVPGSWQEITASNPN